MKSFEKISNLADKFEDKLKKYAQQTSQTGTVELFFDSESNMQLFGNTIRDPKSSIMKVLNDYYNKSQKSCSMDLKVNAEPGKGANWILTVNPPNIKGAIFAALNNEYKKIMKVGMVDRQKLADAGAKKNGGSGQLDVASLELSS